MSSTKCLLTPTSCGNHSVIVELATAIGDQHHSTIGTILVQAIGFLVPSGLALLDLTTGSEKFFNLIHNESLSLFTLLF